MLPKKPTLQFFILNFSLFSIEINKTFNINFGNCVHECRQLSVLCIALFGHIAQFEDDVPAHIALRGQVNLSVGRPPGRDLIRHPGRPHTRWIDQVRWD